MALAQSTQILLVARRDPQDPVRRILRGAGYAVLSADSPSSVVRTAERSRPALIVLEPGALSPAVTDSLVSFADANAISLVRDWSGPDSLLADVERVLGDPSVTHRTAEELVVGSLRVDLGGHSAAFDGTRLDLTAREFDLLCHLIRHPGWVYSRQELLEQVWGYEFGDPRVVTVHMANLRKKLDAAAPGLELIETVRNVGYKLVVPAATAAVGRESQAGSDFAEKQVSIATPVAEAPGAAVAPAQPALSRPAEERRLVTVLFAHLGGLASLAEDLDFDAVGELVDDLCGLLSSRAQDFGGRMERLGPDAFVALFGAPLAHDNDGEMAVRAAFAMRETVANFASQKRLRELSIHVGINTSMVIASSRGTSSGRYSVVGEALDGAACIAGIAGPGEILAGSETVGITMAILESEPGGAVKVRGSERELIYERVTCVRTRRQPSVTGRGIESALVGRDEQLTLFRSCLNGLDEGVGGVIFIIGEAGIGKSRLVAELRDEATSRGLKWLEARTLSYGQNMSYLPFREIVEADCGIDPEDTSAEREKKLRVRLDRLFADRSGDFLPVLGSVLGLAPVESEVSQPLAQEEESFRRTLNEVAEKYALRISTEQPAIFVFEDAHWLDRSSTTLIQNLLPLSAKAPILGCIVGRADAGSVTLELLDAAHRTEGLRCIEMELNRLSRRDTRQLARNFLMGGDIEPRVMKAIESRSEGNPLFVEEIIRHLVGSGSIRLDDHGGWGVVGGGAALAIPPTLQGVVAAGIDRLADRPRQELLHASVIGRSFYRALLRDLSGTTDEEFEGSLGELQDHQFIFVKQREPDLEYSFKHALVQEAAYGVMLPKQRKELHRKVAIAIEERYSGRIKDLYGILAYHYTKAEDWENAQNYLLKAGDQAVSIAADAEAVAYYQDAMAALLRAFDESWEGPGSWDRVGWFVTRTEPFWLAGCLGDLLDSVRVFYDKVSSACGPSDPRTFAATIVLGGCLVERGQYDEAAEILQRTLQTLEQSDREGDSSASRLFLLLGLCRLSMDRFSEAESLLERALVLESKKAEVGEGLLAEIYIYLTSAYFFTGRHDELRRISEEALQRFKPEESQQYWMLRINLCAANLLMGNWEEAASEAQQCVDGISSPYMRAFAERHLGEVRHAQRAYLEAEEDLQSAVALFEDLGNPVSTAEALNSLAEAQLQAGKPEKAQETALRALRFLETNGPSGHSFLAATFWTLAGVEMGRGNLEEAERLLEKSALVVREKYSLRHPLRAELRFRTGQLRLRQGCLDEANESLEQAIELLADTGGASHPRIAQMKIEWQREAAG